MQVTLNTNNKPLKVLTFKSRETSYLQDFIKKNGMNRGLIYGEKFSNNNIVDLKYMSNENLLVKDIYPIGNTHLLLMPKAHAVGSLSLIPEESKQIFQKDVEVTLASLQSMYPNRDIIFFEHGTGDVVFDNTPIPATKKRVDIAHGHFLIPPEGKNNNFLKLVNLTIERLKEDGWKNLENKQLFLNKIIPDCCGLIKAIGKKNGIEIAPTTSYFSIGELNSLSNKEQLFFLSKESINGEAAGKKPSQLLRLIASQIFYNDNNEDLWNWKKLLSDIEAQKPLSDTFKDRIKSILSNDKFFEMQLRKLKSMK